MAWKPLKYRTGSIARLVGGVAVEHRRDVGPEILAEARLGPDRLVEAVGDELGRQGGVAQPGGDPVGHRAFQGGVVEDRRHDEGRELRLVAHHRLGLGAQARPDRVADRQRLDIPTGNGSFAGTGNGLADIGSSSGPGSLTGCGALAPQRWDDRAFPSVKKRLPRAGRRRRFARDRRSIGGGIGLQPLAWVRGPPVKAAQDGAERGRRRPVRRRAGDRWPRSGPRSRRPGGRP